MRGCCLAKKIGCFVLLLMAVLSASAQGLSARQQRDSIRRAKLAALAKNKGETVCYYDIPMQSGLPVFDSMSYPLDGFHIYDEAYTHHDFRANRGNFGMPDQLLEYVPRSTSGFSWRTNPFSSWFYTPQNLPFFQTKTPYTTLYYVNNFGKDMNYFKATYHQNVVRGLNLGADFRVYDVYGDYINSRSNQYNVRFSGNYISRDARYRLLFGYLYNMANVGENGGIRQDSLFTSGIDNNRLRMPVNLASASTRWRQHRGFFKQSYHFYHTGKDSILENNRSYGYLTHEFDVEHLLTSYQDKTTAADGFYKDFLLSPEQSTDTTRLLKVTNRFYYSSSDMEYIPFGYRFKFAAGVKNEYIRWRDEVKCENWVQWFPFARIQMDFADKFVFDAYMDIGWFGYNFLDVSAWAKFKYLFKDDRERTLSKRDGVQVQLGWNHYTPDWIYNHHLSNHHYWDNENTQTSGIRKFGSSMDYYLQFDFACKGWWVRARGVLLNDYRYLTKDGPAVAPENFVLASVVAGKRAHLGRYVGLDNLVMLAHASRDYMHLPLFSLQESFYGIIPVKNITQIHIGLEFIYNTSYYADAYDPSLASYYWQNDIKTGNFLFMNVFLNFQVKRANIFLKGNNIAEGLFKRNYIQTPHYPLQDRNIRFGVSWRFFD